MKWIVGLGMGGDYGGGPPQGARRVLAIVLCLGLLMTSGPGCILGRIEVKGPPTTRQQETELARVKVATGAIKGDILRLEVFERLEVERATVRTQTSTVYPAGEYDKNSAAFDTIVYVLLFGFLFKPMWAIRDGLNALDKEEEYVWGGPIGVFLSFFPFFWVTASNDGRYHGFDQCSKDRANSHGTSTTEEMLERAKDLRKIPFVGDISVECHAVRVPAQTDKGGCADVWVSRDFGLAPRAITQGEAVYVVCGADRIRVQIVEVK